MASMEAAARLASGPSKRRASGTGRSDGHDSRLHISEPRDAAGDVACSPVHCQMALALLES